jgi:hypothetical protein
MGAAAWFCRFCIHHKGNNMRAILYLALLALTLTGASGGVFAQGAPGAPEMDCPAQDFRGFFDAFVGNEAVQRAFARPPPKRLEFAYPPVRIPFLETRDRPDIEFPLFPSPHEWADAPPEFLLRAVKKDNNNNFRDWSREWARDIKIMRWRPAEQERNARGYSLYTSAFTFQTTETEARVVTWRPGEDRDAYLLRKISYTFRKDGCWNLDKIEVSDVTPKRTDQSKDISWKTGEFDDLDDLDALFFELNQLGLEQGKSFDLFRPRKPFVVEIKTVGNPKEHHYFSRDPCWMLTFVGEIPDDKPQEASPADAALPPSRLP